MPTVDQTAPHDVARAVAKMTPPMRQLAAWGVLKALARAGVDSRHALVFLTLFRRIDYRGLTPAFVASVADDSGLPTEVIEHVLGELRELGLVDWFRLGKRGQLRFVLPGLLGGLSNGEFTPPNADCSTARSCTVH